MQRTELEDSKGAISDYTRAIAINPKDANVYFARGIAKSNLEDMEGVCSDWKKAVELGSGRGKKKW
ncbi:MAG: tetratricopeptide repeat protein [Ignavibacteriales bacterium]|nr:tetratricopeptide repeat protein [Ignavibacteriales bacterium]